jgi:nitrogenase-stabilizing/protective protein
MTILDQLAGLSSAEDFFTALAIPYEAAVLNVARLHILRRMGAYMREAGLDGMEDDAAWQACRAHLLKAYEDFQRSSPIEQRVFKVHQDAVKPAAPRNFVPLTALSPRLA